MIGDDVILVYHRVGTDILSKVNHPVPFRSLIDFERVSDVAIDGSAYVQFVIPWTKFTLTNNSGEKVLYNGTHYIDITDSNSSVSIYLFLYFLFIYFIFCFFMWPITRTVYFLFICNQILSDS